MEDIWRNIILALRSIDDHQRRDYTHLTQKQPTLKDEAAFRTKNSQTEEMASA
jgi:hypothetical protein